MSPPKPPPVVRPPIIRAYVLTCIGALAVLFLTMWERNLFPWALIPVLIGALGLALRWRKAALFVLILLGLVLFGEALNAQHQPGSYPEVRPVRRVASSGPFEVTDLLIVTSFLIYMAAHYRLLGLTKEVFPYDPRIEAANRAPPARPSASTGLSFPLPVQRRTAQRVRGNELVGLLLLVPVWVGTAVLVWLWLRARRPSLPVHRDVWYLFVLLWLSGLVLVCARSVFGYLRQTTLTPEEATLYLQDVQWLETRHEQRLLNRWLDWARRRARAKEKT